MMKLEEVFTLEILIKILSKIFVKGNYCITKEDINTKNCRVMIFESKMDMSNFRKNGDEEFINMLFYFYNKNYLFFIVYCLNKKNIVYLNFFNPLLSEKESIESINLFFINNFFPHIILGLNNGKVFLYNHEGIICMQNKFVDSKIKLIFVERQKEYILFVYENNTVVNTNLHLIKRALESNSKVLPLDYSFTVNKNMTINHIFLRNNNYSPDVFKKELYCIYSRDDLARYITDAITSNQPQCNRIANANYVITSKTITISILSLIRQNATYNDLLTKKENFGASEKLSSRINNFLKNMFTKKNDPSGAMVTASVAASPSSGGTTSQSVTPSVGSASTALSVPSPSAASNSTGVQMAEPNAIIPQHNTSNTYGNVTDNLSTQIVHCFNDAKRQIIDICICPWNQNLVLALDNLGRICLLNICTLSILHMWKSYRSAFMSFIQRRKLTTRPSANLSKGVGGVTGTSSTAHGENEDQLDDKAIFFYLKTRNLIEIWDLRTLHKVYSVRTYEDPQLFKIFFADHDVPNKIYFFSTSHHVFLMNTNFELFHVKWPA
ncbi:Uncharacterized protein PCOAH_00021820 [Plasmodium coatneyi]|uniref:Rab3-GAP regulatory subunit N-terminal domain-containing protein n=1 Tax=Plasmodium coatneyi TaxID=208452 RepID=A0A1B1DY10_9APIC|nr:Uncharacterized protein PCOAH_00021820 [Plasmodium coatneyi]ANQ07701.1 Uncharacterized protein PCOAH_00021820 [Plasmodium coatneyi]